MTSSEVKDKPTRKPKQRSQKIGDEDASAFRNSPLSQGVDQKDEDGYTEGDRTK